MAGVHHTGPYRSRARAVVAAANADPSTLCWRCKRTLAQHPPHKTGQQARWTAGHINDGQINGPLLPEASTCNYTAGAKLGRARQLNNKLSTTLD